MNFKIVLRFTLMASCLLVMFTSCADLSIAPVNIVNKDQGFETEQHVKSQLARLYSQMPIEDFRYCPRRLFNNFNTTQPTATLTGEALGRDVKNAYSERLNTENDRNNYWDEAYILIREASGFIDRVQGYTDKYTQAQIDAWTGEALFARAFAHFALAKRYGGVPCLDRVLNYPEVSVEETYLPRNSEEYTWDFIAQQFDLAIAKLPEKNEMGRATKYAAAAIKGRAMLYAGCVAKYNDITLMVGNDRVCGMPAARAKDFFKQAYEAEKMVMDSKNYSLYMKEWKAGDKEAQYTNYVKQYFVRESPENILVKLYQYPVSVHGYDAYNIPRQWIGPDGYSSAMNPTVDFVEMFEVPGLERDANGRFKTVDDNGKYIQYDNRYQPFEGAEPRLRGLVILPEDYFKGEKFDVQRGIYIGSTEGGIDRLIPEGYTGTYPSGKIVQSPKLPQDAYTLPDGRKMNPAGASGVFSDNRECSYTGFNVRKYLDESRQTALVKEKYCDQTWIEVRYAEVLISLAEAAMELESLGEALPGGSNAKSVAFEQVNTIRNRAGATLLAGSNDVTIDVVRKERRKELALEHITWWDLKRWRVISKEQSSTKYRTMMPFYVAKNGKYFFDIRFDEKNITYTFDTRWYYQEIPGGELSKNPNMKQNPGY